MGKRSSQADDAVLQQAAEWFALLHADTVEDGERHRWQLWLDASPRHADAWRRVEAMSLQFERLPQVAHERAAVQALGTDHGAARRRALKSVAVLGVGAASAWSVGRDEGWMPWRADHYTAIGEQRQLVLADGSRLWLNSASAVSVNFHAEERSLHLLKGELLVETAHDPRPFLVGSVEGQLRALGTRFGVYRDGLACQLSVFEGAVEVCSAQTSARVVVNAGQQLRFDHHSLGSIESVRPGREAWTRGQLVADNMRLADFLAELSRHQWGRLACAGEVADLRLVGVFPLADIEKIYAALEHALPVRVKRTMPWWRQVEAA